MVKSQIKTKSSLKDSDAGKESFQYQMELLKMEIEAIDNIVARLDGMAQATKNWTISIWTGSLYILLSQPELRKYILITAVSPFLFWSIDAMFRRLQRRSIYRAQKIKEFVNSPKLTESYENNQLIDFIVYDTTGTQYKGTKEYRAFISLSNTFRFPEVGVFYFVLIAISIILGAFFLLAL
jgi:hypothetical protein